MLKCINSFRLLVMSLSLLILSACGGGGGDPTTVAPTDFAVNVSVVDLQGQITFVNQTNNDLLTIRSADGLSGTFNTRLKDADDFSVAISRQPDGQICNIVKLDGTAITGTAAGTIAAADVAIEVTCTTQSDLYAINVTVTGLGANKSVGLLNLGGDPLTVNANNVATPFTNRLTDGTKFSVTLDSGKQPDGQACNIVTLDGAVVNNGSAVGTIAGKDVTVAVSCADVAVTYTVSITVSGLSATTIPNPTAADEVNLILNKNVSTGAELKFSSDGTASFSTLVGDNQIYEISFNQTAPNGGQPENSVCEIDPNNAVGRINGANVTVSVTCRPGLPVIVKVSNLVNIGMELLNNGGDRLLVEQNKNAPTEPLVTKFKTLLSNGAAYLVTIDKQPVNQNCKVLAPGTTISPPSAIVKIECATTYSVSVNVAGFQGNIPITVDDLDTPQAPAIPLNGDGLVEITGGLLAGATYNVQVVTSPQQSCSLANVADGVGTITNKNVILPISCGRDLDNDGILDGNDFFPNDANRHAKDSIVLSTLSGVNGFTIAGIDEGDLTGTAVSNIGDFNNDNIDDFAITAQDANGTSSRGVINQVFDVGETYIIFGKSVWTAADKVIDPSTLNGENGIIITGIKGLDQSGISVTGIGDINGDAVEDILIGALNADTDSDFAIGNINDITNAGEAYVVFGNRNWAAATAATPVKPNKPAGTLNLSDFVDKAPPLITDNSNGFIISGISAGDLSGSSVTGLGNIDTDLNGYNDFAIGARALSVGGTVVPSGGVYVIYGSATFKNISLRTIGNTSSTNGFLIVGLDSSLTGSAIDNAGDINNDGVPDIIVGAPSANGQSGETYVIFGKTSSFPSIVDVEKMLPSVGVTFKGINPSDESGASVSGAGDINDDGFDDIIIGSKNADTTPQTGGPGDVKNQGESYVIFGRALGIAWPASTNLSSLKSATADGSIGFVIQGLDALDVSGYAVSGGGDVNGDGISDIVVGAIAADPTSIMNAGETYVIFGRSDAVTAWPKIFDLMTLDGTNGFTIFGINAGDNSGFSLDSSGDYNQDGAADIVIGAPNAMLKAGQGYVIFGCDYNYSNAIDVCVK